jgi:hypothetical protein
MTELNSNTLLKNEQSSKIELKKKVIKPRWIELTMTYSRVDLIDLYKNKY